MSEARRARTKFEAILDLKYHIRLHWLHQRLYRRIRTAIAFVSLIASSGALASLMQTYPAGIFIAGTFVTIAGFADIVGNFAEKAAKHAMIRRELCELLARCDSMTLQQLDGEVARLDSNREEDIESLRSVAMNDNLKTAGYESWMRPENRMQRFVRALA